MMKRLKALWLWLNVCNHPNMHLAKFANYHDGKVISVICPDCLTPIPAYGEASR